MSPLYYAFNAFEFVYYNLFWIGSGIYALVLLRRARRQLVGFDRDERAGQIRLLATKYLRRFVLIAGGWYVIGSMWTYYGDVQIRRSAYACHREYSPHDGGQYIAENCSLAWAGDTGRVPNGYSTLFRVYSATTNELLAEHFVPNAEGGIRWGESWSEPFGINGVTLNGGDNHGITGVNISLPPSKWEQLMAKLP